MHISFSERTVDLSVTDLANFRLGPRPSDARPTGRWRAEVGMQWHQTLREQLNEAVQADPGRKAIFEASLLAQWDHAGWTFRIQGRIDQILHEPDGICLREVKTVRRALPLSTEELEHDYPDYFNQAAIYLALAPSTLLKETALPVRAEVVFVDIDQGLTQSVAINDAEDRLDTCLQRLTNFLNARLRHSLAVRGLDFLPPFNRAREGQLETSAALRASFQQSRITVLEAPTGFGKTGLALQIALESLRDGLVDRIIYLTAKSTGQVEVCQQLAAMRPPEGGFNYLQMRSRAEHGGSPIPSDQLEAAWSQANLPLPDLFQDGTVDLPRIQELGEQHQLPPYEITRALLPWADIWIGDCNYIFSPRHAGVFLHQPGFDPARTCLIVDEAHNLPSRTAEAWSASFRADALHLVAGELAALLPFSSLPDSIDDLARECEAFPRTNTPPPEAEYAFIGAIENTVDRLLQNFPDPDAISELTREILWDLLDTRRLQDHRIDRFMWSPAKGEVRLTCLDAAPFIATDIEPFAHTLLMSATLRPIEPTLASFGISPDKAVVVEAAAPWRTGAYDVAVDARISTVFRDRPRTVAITAETVAKLSLHSRSPLVVFFPSYKYAENVMAYCPFYDPALRIALAPRGLSLAEQTAFIEENLLTAHALFLVLGTGFTEGIDLLGGRVDMAMVVGPALPEVNSLQEARREAFQQFGPEAAFNRAYLIPAMIKINQALGRLIRAPGQRARILLHCRRFTEKNYQDLIDPVCSPKHTLRTDLDLENWLHQLQR